MAKPKAHINQSLCLACGGCISVCSQDAIAMDGRKAFIEKIKCISCGICINTCPVGAIDLEDKK